MSNPARSPIDAARLAAFCDPKGPEVFGAIVHGSMIWKPDPFDVEAIHGEARAEFSRLLHRASTPSASGKSLLLLGEAGSGKTHLMRAFRNETHAARLGYCGYLQMTARTDNYARYVLSNLVDALDQPYLHPHPQTGFGRLALGLLDTLDIVSADERRRLCDEIPTLDELSTHVQHISDFVVQYDQFKGVDLDLIRALLYLLSHDGRIRPRVLKWLRCENLSRSDCEILGGLEPRSKDDQPRRMIEGLGRMMSILHQAALVLCVDQLEETIDQLPSESDGARWHHLRQAINVLIDITDALPNAIVVVACLEDLFQAGRNHLPQPKLDRLLHDPEEVRLSSVRSLEEIESMLSRRLGVLYAAAEVGEPEAIYPFQRDHLQSLVGKRTRDVLEYFRRQRDRCLRAGDWVEPEGATPVQAAPTANPLRLEQAWNDALASFAMPTLDDETHVASLLAWAFAHVPPELPPGFQIRADVADADVNVGIERSGSVVAPLLVSVCNRAARGGGLKKQLLALAERAGSARVVVVRTSPFPVDPKTEIAKQLASLTEPKGTWRREEISATDLRFLEALRVFFNQHQSEADFHTWQSHQHPLSSIKSIHAILALEALQGQTLITEPPSQNPQIRRGKSSGSTRSSLKCEPGVLHLGETRGLEATPVTLPIHELTRHAAFLGDLGSGPSTVALNLIEQILEQGVPALVIDRRGDSSRHAGRESGLGQEGYRLATDHLARLQERTDVVVFTPNNPLARPLTFPLVPAGSRELPGAERERMAQAMAAGLSVLMGYSRKPNDPKLVILAKAIELLGTHSEEPVWLNQAKQLVVERADALCLELAAFEDRHYQKLGEDLEALALRHPRLLGSADVEILDVEMLLGLGRFAQSGKTRLTIIDAQSLGDAPVIDFWIVQFLIALDCWSTKHSSPDRLQAIIFFNEADQYLPATRRPATRAPLESLLHRAGSRGIGLFLATQKPGAFDCKYRDQIYTWLFGQIREQPALDKLRPLLNTAAGNLADRLPGQAAGEYYLLRGKELQAIRTTPSLLAEIRLNEDRS